MLENIRMKNKILIALMLIFSLLALGCASKTQEQASPEPKNYDDLKATLQKLIKREMKKRKIVGVSIALVDDQQVVWAEGFGYADRENNIVATEKTVYQVGSISKIFTDTAVMQLYEQGIMDIDKPLKTYLPEFSIKTRFPNSDPITPRNIMTHHSGIPTDWLKADLTRSPEPLSNIVDIINMQYTAFPPNFAFCYSNQAISLLGHTIGKLNNQDFASYLDDKVIFPMGMANSSFTIRPDFEELVSKSYHKGKVREPLSMRDMPAGSLYSNVIDLSQLMKMVFADGKADENQILKPETLTEMMTQQNENIPLDFDTKIGLGWFLSFNALEYAGRVAFHDGSTIFYKSMLITLPDHKLGVVVLGNSTSSDAITGKAAYTALKMALEIKTGLKAPEPPEDPPRVDSISSETMNAFDGDYDTMFGFIPIHTKGKKLIMELLGMKFKMTPHEDGIVSPRLLILGLIPLKIPGLSKLFLSTAEVSGQQALVLNSGGKKSLFGVKISPKPAPPAWVNRLGTYEVVIENENEIYFIRKITLEQHEEFLLAKAELAKIFGGQKLKIALDPVSDNEAVFMGVGRNRGDTVFAYDTKAGERILYSGYEFKKIE